MVIRSSKWTFERALRGDLAPRALGNALRTQALEGTTEGSLFVPDLTLDYLNRIDQAQARMIARVCVGRRRYGVDGFAPNRTRLVGHQV